MQLKLDITEKLSNQLEDMRKVLKLKSKVAVFRKAFKVFGVVIDCYRNGYELVLKKDSEEIKIEL